jgi:hypothetical protein
LIEECAEVIQRATKVQRFGLDEIQPGQVLDNQQRLAEEVSDLHGTLELLREHGVGLIEPGDSIKRKMTKVREFMKYSQEQGTLRD